jgi:hypothetical protein
MTPEQRTEFRTTGELPKPKETPQNDEESAPSDPPKEAEADAGDPPPPKTPQERSDRDKAKAAKRFNDLLEENKRLKSDLEARNLAESSPAKPEAPKPQEFPPTRPKPTADEKTADGKDKYATYEDYIEDLADWKGEQREAKAQRENAHKAEAEKFWSKVDEARGRYERFDEVVQPTATAINTDADISPVIKQLLIESDVLPDILFTIGSDPAELAKFTEMAKKTPGKAIRYIALIEAGIADELENKKSAASTEETPAKPQTKAPKPPSEAGGRAAAPPDGLESAAKANDFRAFKAESNRRAIAKLDEDSVDSTECSRSRQLLQHRVGVGVRQEFPRRIFGAGQTPAALARDEWLGIPAPGHQPSGHHHQPRSGLRHPL